MKTLQEKINDYFGAGGTMPELSFLSKTMPVTIWRIREGVVKSPRKDTAARIERALKKLHSS